MYTYFTHIAASVALTADVTIHKIGHAENIYCQLI